MELDCGDGLHERKPPTGEPANRGRPFAIEVADRVKRLPPYLFARINKLRSEKRRAGDDVIDLGMGNPSDPPADIVIDKLAEAARDPQNHGYSEAWGMLNLRRDVAAKYYKQYGVRLDPERELLVCLGSKEGFSHMCLALLGPGDSAIVPALTIPPIFSPWPWQVGARSSWRSRTPTGSSPTSPTPASTFTRAPRC